MNKIKKSQGQVGQNPKRTLGENVYSKVVGLFIFVPLIIKRALWGRGTARKSTSRYACTRSGGNFIR